MSPKSDSGQGFPRVDEPGRHVPDQQTVLLSDAPTVPPPAVQPEAPPSVQGYASPVLPVLAASLSAAALAALSQRYDILAEAGHGSMGNVYKARDRETGETVALKLLKPEIASDQAMMDRFKNELLFARKITHKNICRVHEFNRIGGIAYTSMEFVQGESLRSVLNRFGGLPPRKVIDLAQQMCSGLKEAHAQGIVHRDLKPENVMIDENGNVKIMDFGIARSMEMATRFTGSMVGTPAYMAPEQVGGKPVDYRTDIYSLGLILYEMFTGEPAFQADNAVAVALKQMQENPRPPHEIEPNIPAAMERVVLKCLEKEPARRFQSAAELETVIKVPGAPAPRIARPVPVLDMPVPAERHVPHLGDAVPPRSHSTAGLVFAWLLLFGALGFAGYAGWFWLAPITWPDAFSFPQAPPTPKVPDFALETSDGTDAVPAAQTGAQTAAQAPALASPGSPDTSQATDKPAANGTVAAKPEASGPADAMSDAGGDASDATAGPAPVQTSSKAKSGAEGTSPRPATQKSSAAARDFAPSGAQQGANKAFSGNGSEAVVNAVLSGMIWVGRYERRDRADDAAKEIQDLGLTATVVPRNNGHGQFFVVFTGPYSGKKLTDTTSLLQADGFSNARPVQSMEENSSASPILNQQQGGGGGQQP